MAGCVNYHQHQLVTGSKLFCCQSWISHVGCEGTVSGISAKMVRRHFASCGQNCKAAQLPGRIRRLKRTVPFTFRRLEGGLEGEASRGA